MTKGLKFGLGILLFGCAIPIITAFLTLRGKPVYHTESLTIENTFVQFSWQEKPVANLEHVLLFFEKPESYKASPGLDVRPPAETDGYWVFPRGVFYKNEPLLQPVKKILKRQKKDVRLWVIHRGKAFPVELSEENNDALKEIVVNFKNHDVDQETLRKTLIESKAWPEAVQKFKVFQKEAENGKIDFTPRKRRSQFMTF